MGEKKTHQISFRIDEETKAALQALAAAEHRTVSGYVLHLIFLAIEGKIPGPESESG